MTCKAAQSETIFLTNAETGRRSAAATDVTISAMPGSTRAETHTSCGRSVVSDMGGSCCRQCRLRGHRPQRTNAKRCGRGIHGKRQSVERSTVAAGGKAYSPVIIGIGAAPGHHEQRSPIPMSRFVYKQLTNN